MPRRRARNVVELLTPIAKKLRDPLGIILGSPRQVVNLVQNIDCPHIDCYQMDLFQAERLQEELGQALGKDAPLSIVEPAGVQSRRSLPLTMAGNGDQAGIAKSARLFVGADLWDLPSRYQTLVYPVPEKGERSLKLDVIEQAFHTLRPGGTLIVLSPYEKDDLFRTALKKVYGSGIHEPEVDSGSVFWCQRNKEHARRRHEIVFQVRASAEVSVRFTSRPGVFCYGRLDNGARALVETMEIAPGERVLDMGCGIGSNGIHAALQAGPEGHIVFLDSNLRALTLAELNARNAGLTNFRTVASSGTGALEKKSFDVVLANPPYYGQGSIAERFVIDALEVLRPGGRLYLVTKQLDAVATIVAETFGEADVFEARGYFVICAAA